MTSLRVIGGMFKNRLLKSPKGEATRPTSAILRKSVFDICQSFIQNASFLDLYAGTGAMGFEALSRGATHITFVENERAALHAIEENMRALDVIPLCTLIRADAHAALKRLAAKEQRFDLIYMDPPYRLTASALEILIALDQSSLLKEGGTLFVEEALPSHLKPEGLKLTHLHLINSRHFGKSLLHQFRRRD